MTVKNFLFFPSSAASPLGALRPLQCRAIRSSSVYSCQQVRNSGPNRKHRATKVAGRSWLSFLEANDYANFRSEKGVV